MREILFRAKRLDNGEWIEGYYLKCPHQYSGFLEDHISVSKYDEEEESSIEHIYPVDPETVCQYTGMTDRNGKKIFEGDICKNLDGVFLVFFEYERCGFVMKFNDYLGEILDMSEMWDDTKVIGNIFDNPKELKEGAE